MMVRLGDDAGELLMLFIAGNSLGRYANHRPIRMGLAMMLIGSALVAITIALGG